MCEKSVLRAVYPGTFDPFTMGHLDVARRAAAIFDELIVAVCADSGKQLLFDLSERVQMAAAACAGLENVIVEGFHGLVVDFARARGARVLVKGLRASSDFERERQQAMMNRQLAPDIETLVLLTDPAYAFLSSSLIKEVCGLGGDVSAYVPDVVLEPLLRRLRSGRDLK
ncbi:MAG: pantetheine-phosphate adenylyltransferase [Armatimonadetes bacterium]|nr:pantetheine-phosphate adenylyltransferase [Armatimonadota bacterium]